MTHEFRDKIVVITGGSRGIGAALVRAYASKNAIVYFTYLNGKKVAEELICTISSKNVYGMRVDSKNKEAIYHFINDIGERHGCIDIIVNNAGVVTNPFLYEEKYDRWDETISINLTGVRHYCQATFKYLAKSFGGNIVNMSSMSAHTPMIGMAAYSASKAAVEELSKVLALEYAACNIRVNTVSPGLIDTRVASDLTDDVRNNIIKRTPLRRLGIVDDVVNAILFLSNNQLASFITGAQLYITGGKHLT